MKNDYWTFEKNVEIGYMDGYDYLHINKGVNFLIGKNNSGKTHLMKKIFEKEIKLSARLNNEIKLIYFSTDHNTIMEEIRTINSSISGKEGSVLKRPTNSENNDLEYTTYGFEKSGNKNISDFLEGKVIKEWKETKSKWKIEIDNISSVDSGDGVNRMLYLIFLRDQIIKKYMKETNWEKLFHKLSYFLLNDYRNLISLVNIIKKSKIETLSELKELIESLEEEKSPEEQSSFSEIQIFFQKEIGSFCTKNNLWMKYGKPHYSWEIPNIKSSIFNIDDNAKKIIHSNYIELIKILKDIGFNYDEEIQIKSENIIIIIDEPELYLHSEMLSLFKELIEDILLFNEIDIRFLISTHSEKILRIFNEYIENFNLSYKKDKILKYKNIFNNDFNELVSNFNKFWEEELSFSRESVIWTLTNKENMKIFFNDEINVFEGWSEYFIISSYDNRDWKYLISDGFRNFPLFIELIKMNLDFYKKADFYIDLDYNNKNSDWNKFKLSSKSKYFKEKYKNITLETNYILKINHLFYNDVIEMSNIFIAENIKEKMKNHYKRELFRNTIPPFESIEEKVAEYKDIINKNLYFKLINTISKKLVDNKNINKEEKQWIDDLYYQCWESRLISDNSKNEIQKFSKLGEYFNDIEDKEMKELFSDFLMKELIPFLEKENNKMVEKIKKDKILKKIINKSSSNDFFNKQYEISNSKIYPIKNINLSSEIMDSLFWINQYLTFTNVKELFNYIDIHFNKFSDYNDELINGDEWMIHKNIFFIKHIDSLLRGVEININKISKDVDNIFSNNYKFIIKSGLFYSFSEIRVVQPSLRLDNSKYITHLLISEISYWNSKEKSLDDIIFSKKINSSSDLFYIKIVSEVLKNKYNAFLIGPFSTKREIESQLSEIKNKLLSFIEDKDNLIT